MCARNPLFVLGLFGFIALLLTGSLPGPSAQADVPVSLPAQVALAANSEITARTAQPAAWDANWVKERVDGEKHFAGGDRGLVLDANGYPHVVYGGSQVYYAWYDGTAWRIEMIDNPGVLVYKPMLALDSTGRPHVTYREGMTGRIRYAWRDGASWQVETVIDAIGGSNVALAIDSMDRPHVTYSTGVDPVELKHAYLDGTSWQFDTIEQLPLDNGGEVSLAIDAADYPHVAYNGGGLLRYDYWDGDRWVASTVTSSYSFVSLALDTSGLPHIAYLGADMSLQYARHDGASWQVEEVDYCPVTTGPSLAIGPDAQPRISYYCWYSGGLKYAERGSVGWTLTAVDSWSQDSSLAIDAEGHAHLSYCQFDPEAYFYGQCDTVKYAYNDGTGWQITELDHATGYPAASVSLAVDGAGRPHLCYFEEGTDTDYLKYARNDGSAWQVEQVDSVAPPYGGQSAIVLALDAGGGPHVVYGDAYGQLYYAYRDGSAWITTTLDWTGSGVSMALDELGNPHVSFSTYSNRLVYAWYADGVWSSEVVGWLACPGNTSLALDQGGLAHIAYASRWDRSLLMYAHSVGDFHTWQTEVIDAPVSYFSAPSLVLDSVGRPHVSYSFYDVTTPRPLKHAYRDTSGWHIETLENDVYGSSSLALDSYDRPHIAFTGQHYNYCYYDGTMWVTSTLDTNWASGAPISLALDGVGMPHLGYTQNYELEYTHLNACIPARALDLHGPTDVPAGITTLYTSTYAPLSATLPAVFWDNGALGSTAAYSWTATGEQSIVATLTTPCGQVAGTLGVNVFCEPLQDLDLAGPSRLPAGIAGLYTTTYSPITASLPLTRTWSNGTIASTAAYSWTTPGAYTVTVTATNGCSQTGDALTTTVFCQPLTGLVVQGPWMTTAGRPTLYWPLVEPITASRPITFTWSNGSVGPKATYSWPAVGIYTVTVTATNACGQVRADVAVQVIDHWPYQVLITRADRGYFAGMCIPVDQLTLSGPLSLPISTTGTYTATYSPHNATSPVDLAWDNGTTGSTAAYSWTLPGIYSLTITATNACGQASTTLPITVPAACRPVETVAITGSLTLLPGEAGLYTATYGPPMATLPVSLTWADGTLGPTTAYSWTLPGIYTLTVTATNACGRSSSSFTVTVTAYVAAQGHAVPSALVADFRSVALATLTFIVPGPSLVVLKRRRCHACEHCS